MAAFKTSQLHVFSKQQTFCIAGDNPVIFIFFDISLNNYTSKKGIYGFETLPFEILVFSGCSEGRFIEFVFFCQFHVWLAGGDALWASGSCRSLICLDPCSMLLAAHREDGKLL